jgi:hypothetical protein
VLQLQNTTPFAATIVLLPDANGVDTLYTIIKATFSIRGAPAHVTVADEQVPVIVEPTFRDDPATSSLASASDVSLQKPGTDILVIGDACAPRDRPTPVIEVGVAVGSIRHGARVVGDRTWETDGISLRATPAKPFSRMPLIWERAFGGRDVTAKGTQEEPRNPAGVGFRVTGGRPADQTPLPNIERLGEPITSPKQRATPVCFGPIAPSWEPRRSFAGTYDEGWQTKRAPYLPDDFDSRFLHVAPPELIASPRLIGGEAVELTGFRPDGALRFALPRLRLRAAIQYADRTEDATPLLDTIILEPTAGRLQLVWRAAYACDKRALKIRAVQTTVEHSDLT